MATSTEKKPFFGYRGGWLTFWITASSTLRIYANVGADFDEVACATDMTLFGYDQGVFSTSSLPWACSI